MVPAFGGNKDGSYYYKQNFPNETVEYKKKMEEFEAGKAAAAAGHDHKAEAVPAPDMEERLVKLEALLGVKN